MRTSPLQPLTSGLLQWPKNQLKPYHTAYDKHLAFRPSKSGQYGCFFNQLIIRKRWKDWIFCFPGKPHSKQRTRVKAWGEIWFTLYITAEWCSKLSTRNSAPSALSLTMSSASQVTTCLFMWPSVCPPHPPTRYDLPLPKLSWLRLAFRPVSPDSAVLMDTDVWHLQRFVTADNAHALVKKNKTH